MVQPIENAVHGTMLGVALNYKGLLAAHQAAFEQAPYQKLPVKPVLFIKTPNTRNHHNGTVTHPMDARLQPGPAIGVVIGKRASRVSENDAMGYVAGYTIVNEFSLPEDSYYRPALKAKCRDGYCAIGPVLTPVEQVNNAEALTLQLLVNGTVQQENTSANWVRNVARLIAEISEFMTLNEGDLLITGTPEGRVDVQVGDKVEVVITGLGTLTNMIVAEQG
jgi:5-oxopent-3-ene-1,2,5-tricarboxylate decarboxylase/2-hydroxyhepta-2,4-diene-1,7-dioate isomerase